MDNKVVVQAFGRNGYSCWKCVCAKPKEVNPSSKCEIIDPEKKCLAYFMKEAANETLSTAINITYETSGSGCDCSFHILFGFQQMIE